MVAFLNGGWTWLGDLADRRTAGPGQPDCGKRGKAKRRAANRRARTARRRNR